MGEKIDELADKVASELLDLGAMPQETMAVLGIFIVALADRLRQRARENERR